MNGLNPPHNDSVIRLHIEGPDTLDGDVTLGAFIEKLAALKSALTEAEHLVSPGRHSVDFRVSELSHSSPAMVGLTPYAIGPGGVAPWLVGDTLASFVDQVRNRTAIAASGHAKLVHQLRRLLSGVGEKFERLWIDGTDIPTIHLDAEVARALDDALPDVRREFGTVTGTVRMYSGVAKQPYFRIFPPLDGVEIKCVFSTQLLAQAAQAVERNATVEGMLKYYEGDLWPHEVKVGTITVHARNDDLPTLSQLAGAAPNATGNLTANDFVQQLRESWTDDGDEGRK